MAKLEHVNVTVSDPKATAQMYIDLFDWHIRWEGSAMNGQGYTVHVGTDDGYVALYGGPADKQIVPDQGANYKTRGALNHIAVVVDDLDAAEARVKDLGLTPHSHQDYEPGARFYFHDADGIEVEVVSYS